MQPVTIYEYLTVVMSYDAFKEADAVLQMKLIQLVVRRSVATLGKYLHIYYLRSQSTHEPFSSTT